MKLFKKKELKIVLILFLIALIIRIVFMSNSPNMWDSANYMSHVKDIIYEGEFHVGSMSNNKPLYMYSAVYLTQFLYWISGIVSIEKSLILVSVILGSLSVVSMYYLSKLLFLSKKAGITSALLFCFTPLIWWFSEEAMSDVPAMFFTVASFALLFQWYRTDKNWSITASTLLFGVGLLFRFANIFIIPAYGFIVLWGCYYKKTIKWVFYTLLTLLPLTIYITLEKLIFHPQFPLKEFFISPYGAIKFSFKTLLDPLQLLGNIYFIINGMTITVLSLTILAIIFLIYKSYKKNKDATFILLFTISWILPSLIYYTGIPPALSRFMISIIPALTLLAVYSIENQLFEKIRKNWLIAILALSILFDLLLNYLNMHEIYYGEGILGALSQFTGFINLPYIIISLIIISVAINICLRMKKTKKQIIITTLIIIMIFHALPILNLITQKTNYQKSIAVWYKENSPKDSLLLTGQDKPFTAFYVPSREITWFKPELYEWEDKDRADYTRVKKEIELALKDGKKIFTSSDHYIKPIIRQLEKDFTLIPAGTLSSKTIRNQFDWGFVFMNYASMSKAEDIIMYNIKKREIELEKHEDDIKKTNNEKQ